MKKDCATKAMKWNTELKMKSITRSDKVKVAASIADRPSKWKKEHTTAKFVEKTSIMNVLQSII
jgi:hypothetical protein